MEGRERAELKNDVLRFLVEKKVTHRPNDIYGAMARPVKSLEHFIELLQEMRREAGKYMGYDLRTNGSISVVYRNAFTQEFLDAGGFVNQYESDQEADREAERLSEEEKWRKRREYLKLKYWWALILISLVSLIIAIASYFRPAGVSQEQIDDLNEKIEQIHDSDSISK